MCISASASPGTDPEKTLGALAKAVGLTVLALPVSGALGAAYTWFGRALKPLFYLNRNYWGEQLLLVARPRG